MWSLEANIIMAFMLRELNTTRYGYRSFIEGCYQSGIKRHGLAVPEEPMSDIVDRVLEILNGEE